MNNKIKESIIMNVTGLSKNQLFLNPDFTNGVTKVNKNSFASLVNPGVEIKKEIDEKTERYNKGEPIEYIINKAEFFGFDFYVDNRVLIPRDDTEVMVDKVLETIKGIIPPPPGSPFGKGRNNGITLVDVGTGSSCIPISIFKSTDIIDRAYVVDISKKALEVSKINIEKHNLNKKIIQINGSLLNKLLTNSYKLDKKLIITANLPYIKDQDFDNMSDSTVKYEPDLALYGGKDTGFELYEELINQCIVLENKGYNLVLFIEIGFDQYEYSKNYLEKLGLENEYFKDNGGIYRCVKIKFGKN